MHRVLWSPLVDGNPQEVPEDGRGTYHIRNWTLWLRLDSGFEQSQDFFILDDRIDRPPSVRLRGFTFDREK